ncbi:MAG TPA: integrase core domain-containing protein [Syntrophales bacterium]|nr:integrase core domain-containing protein [Syntrophales bacterium]
MNYVDGTRLKQFLQMKTEIRGSGQYLREYNHFRPHSSLGYRPSAPETIQLKNPTLYLVQ